jgi:hypothetical protein
MPGADGGITAEELAAFSAEELAALELEEDALTAAGGAFGAVSTPLAAQSPGLQFGARSPVADPLAQQRVAAVRAQQELAQIQNARLQEQLSARRRQAAIARARTQLGQAEGGGASGLTVSSEETARFTQLLATMGQSGIGLVAEIFAEARKDDRSDTRPNANVNMSAGARAAAAKAFVFALGACLGAEGQSNFEALRTGKYEVNMKKVGMTQRAYMEAGEAILSSYPALSAIFNMTYLLIARKFGRPKMALLRRAIVGSEVVAVSEDKGKERRVEELLRIKTTIMKAFESQGIQGVDAELFMNAVFLACSMVIGKPKGTEGRLGAASSRKVKHMAGMVYGLQLIESQSEVLKEIPAPVANTLVRSNIIADGQPVPCLLWALYAPADPDGDGVPEMVGRAYDSYKFYKDDMNLSCKMYTFLEAINDSQAKMSNELRLGRIKPGYTAKLEGRFKDLLKVKEMAGAEGVSLESLGAWAETKGWNFSKE